MRLPSLAQGIKRRPATTLFHLAGDARALPWHPQQEQNRHPPIFASSGRCQTGRSPLPIFFLLPSPGLADGQGFMRGVCAEPVTLRRETMSNRTVKDASKDIVFVPLSRLKKSPKNVRKVPHTKADIKAFAASIAA